MRSRDFSPNAHYLKYVAKRYSWLALISLAVIGLHTWFDALMDYGKSKAHFTFVGVSTNMDNTIFYASALVAIIFAFVLFSFLWNKKEAFSTLSLGVSRKNQFLIRYLFGAGLLLITYIPSFAISYFINMARLVDDEIGLTSIYAVNYTLMFCAIALAIYTLAVLTAILSGRLIDGVLSVISLLAAPYAIGMLLRYVFSNFLLGAGLAHNADASVEMWEWGEIFKPITDYTNDLGAFTAFKDFFNITMIPIRLGQSGTVEEWYLDYINQYREDISLPILGFILTLAVTAIFALAAYFCFVRRPAEGSGKAGIYPVFYCTAAAIGALGAALPIFLLPINRFLILLCYCAVFAIHFFILTAIYNSSIKAYFSRYKTALIAVGAVCLCAIVCNFGGLGYSYKVPEADKVDRVIMEYLGNPVIYHGSYGGTYSSTMNIVFYDQKGNPISFDDRLDSVKSVEKLHWYVNLAYVPEITETEDVEKAIEIHKAVIRDGIRTRGDCGYDPNDPSATTVKADWHIVYVLTDGTRIERYYEYLSLASIETISTIEESSTYRDFYISQRLPANGEQNISEFQLDGQMFEAADEFFSDVTALDMLSLEEKQELFEALVLDFADLTFEERYFSDEKVIGTIRLGRWLDTESGIMLSTRREAPEDSGCNVWYVTEKYTRALEFLEEKGLMYVFNGNITVEKVEIQAFDPYIFGANPTGSGVLLAIQSYDYIIHTPKNSPVTEIPESEWDSYVSRSRAIAGTTRGGTLVRITYTTENGLEKVIDRLIPNE